MGRGPIGIREKNLCSTGLELADRQPKTFGGRKEIDRRSPVNLSNLIARVRSTQNRVLDASKLECLDLRSSVLRIVTAILLEIDQRLEFTTLFGVQRSVVQIQADQRVRLGTRRKGKLRSRRGEQVPIVSLETKSAFIENREIRAREFRFFSLQQQ